MSEDNKIELTQEELQAKIAEATQAAIEKEVAGLKANRDQLKLEKQEARSQLDQLQGQLDSLNDFGGVDKITQLMERIEKDEEMKLLADGKLEDVLERRTERMKADYDSKFDALEKRAIEAEESAKAITRQMKEKVLVDSIRSAAIEAEVQSFAVEDAILRAKNVFSLDENENMVARDASGNILYGPDAKTPLTPSEWLDSLKPVAKHWWKQPKGSDSTGSLGGDYSQERNPFDKKSGSYNLTEAARISQENPELAARLKAAAGL